VAKEKKDPVVWPGISIREDVIGLAKDSTLSSALPRLLYGYEYDSATWYPIKTDTYGKVYTTTEVPTYTFTDTFDTNTTGNYDQRGDTLNYDEANHLVYFERTFSGTGTWAAVALVKDWSGKNIKCSCWLDWYIDSFVRNKGDWFIFGPVVRASNLGNFIIAGVGWLRLEYTRSIAGIAKVVDYSTTLTYWVEIPGVVVEVEVIANEDVVALKDSWGTRIAEGITDDVLKGCRLFGIGYIHHNAAADSYYENLHFAYDNFSVEVRGEKGWW